MFLQVLEVEYLGEYRLGVRFSDLVQGRPQLNLFEDTPEDTRLMAALDRIRSRFGTDAVKRGSTIDK